MRLQNKHIVISGASKGLGKALALRFASEGASVALCSRTQAELDSVKKEILAAYPNTRVHTHVCDISNQKQVDAFVQSLLNEFGTIDVLVNNAGALGPRVPIAEYPATEWERVVQTNLNGTYYLTHKIVPSMISQKSGAIINVTSTVGKTGRAKWGAYAVSKFAIEGMTQVLSEELKAFNISVNSVNPGPLATEMRRQAYPTEDQSYLRKPEEVTDVFVYLASAAGAGISGQWFDAANYYAPKEIK
ncbi:MAG: SDR family oxidoreductase [Ignavibacteriae bacterium]|nr:SDR family oxidoreductase [Ignavibacteriota bacterium]